ncbi:MAG: histidine kinase [Anaerolineae bacterium]
MAVTLTGVYSHQRAMRDFVSERDRALASLYSRQIEDALAHATVLRDGRGLSQVILEARIARRGVVYVVSTDGRVLFHPNTRLVGTDRSTDRAVRQIVRLSSGTVGGELADGSLTLASFATVSETGWRVIVEEPVDDIIVPILRFSSALPFLLLIAGFLSLLVVFFSFRTIAQPLQSLSQAASQATGGNLVLPTSVGGIEEIRDLQRALGEMVERVRSYQASVHDYVDQITSSQEVERARLSRELHDQTVQDLVAVAQRLQMTQRALDRGNVDVAEGTLAEARTLCREALGELRRITQALRPIYLEDLGLLPALEMLVDDIRQEGKQAELTLKGGQPIRLPPEVEVAAFRVAQEALSNAIRHAQAQRIRLLVSFEPQELVLSIQDDGVGFMLPTSPEELTHAGHFGLVGMHERVLLLGGRLEIHSEPGAGTVITAHFPV